MQNQRRCGADMTEMKSFKPRQLSTSSENHWTFESHKIYLTDEVLDWSLLLPAQESVPYPGFVLGRLSLCQHERVHCWNSDRWGQFLINFNAPLCLHVWTEADSWSSLLFSSQVNMEQRSARPSGSTLSSSSFLCGELWHYLPSQRTDHSSAGTT